MTTQQPLPVIRFFIIAAGVPLFIWCMVTILRIFLLSMILGSASVFFHAAPFFIEIACFAVYLYHKLTEFQQFKTPYHYDPKRKSHTRTSSYIQRTNFRLEWFAEALNDCRVNLIYVSCVSIVMFVAVAGVGFHSPAWGITNLVICAVTWVVTFGVLVQVADRRGWDYGSPTASPKHTQARIGRTRPGVRGKGLITQEEAQLIWRRVESEE